MRKKVLSTKPIVVVDDEEEEEKKVVERERGAVGVCVMKDVTEELEGKRL